MAMLLTRSTAAAAQRCCQSTVARGLFAGQVPSEVLYPYPAAEKGEARAALEKALGDVADVVASGKPAAFEKLGAAKAFGGSAAPALNTHRAQARLAERIGETDLGAALAVQQHQLGYRAVALVGTDAQKAEVLPKVEAGERVAALCLTEANAGTDVARIETTATVEGDNYVLNGTKTWVANGDVATYFTVFAQTQVDGRKRLSTFLVDRSAVKGITASAPLKTMGLHTCNVVDVTFDNVKLPKTALLGELGSGFKLSLKIRSDTQFKAAAALLGGQRRLLTTVMDHASTRQQFGRRLRDLQLIKQRVADIAMRVYAVESMTYMVATEMDRGQDVAIESAFAKNLAVSGALESADAAMQIFGAKGYLQDGALCGLLNDFNGYRYIGGTDEINKLFATLSGLEHTSKKLNQKSTATVMLNRTKRTFGVMNSSSGAHASLAQSVKILDSNTTMLSAVLENILMKFGKKITDEQMIVAQAAEGMGLLYSMAAVLSRASAAAEAGSDESSTSDAQHELLLASTWCKECGVRLEEICADLKNVYATRYGNLARIADHMAGENGYIPTHPCGI